MNTPPSPPDTLVGDEEQAKQLEPADVAVTETSDTSASTEMSEKSVSSLKQESQSTSIAK